MNTLAKPLTRALRLPRLAVPRFDWAARRRRQAMIDLMHASPYLLRDIGVSDGHATLKIR